MIRIRYIAILSLLLLLAHCKEEDTVQPPGMVFDPTPYELIIPEGFPDMMIPDDNPMTEEGVALGRMLFYDPILSGDDSQSCASCHNQAYSFSDNEKRFSEGIDGLKGIRNAQAVINIGWMDELFWDGRALSVETQALEPVPNPIEMHLSWSEAMDKLKAHPLYPDLFFYAFGQESIDSNQVAMAIAQFERTLISAESKWDKYLRGEASLSQAEAQGFEIFFTEKGDCFHCHSTILFTDNLFRNNGLDSIFKDPGREIITQDPNDHGKFKTPGLRNLSYTAPYMHDGRFATLEEVVDFYSEGVRWSPTIDPLMKQVHQGGVQLNPQEKSNLIAFLKTLNDSSFINNLSHGNPFTNE